MTNLVRQKAHRHFGGTMTKTLITKTLALATVLASGFIAEGAMAQVKVERLDAGTLRVTEFKGKPPHRRQFISQAEHPELFAQYEARVGSEPVALLAGDERRMGAPGKMTSMSRARISSDASEMAEFARFEEVHQPNSSDARRWSGAPGKGRPAR